MILHVSVNNKVATYRKRDGSIVCGNSDYQIKFSFDSEWNAATTKTARFIWNGKFEEVKFTGDTCNVPIITNTDSVEVGVYAGNLKTTTSAQIPCQRSILCLAATPAATNGNTDTRSTDKLKTFIDNIDIDYAYDSETHAHYTVVRVYKNRIDGTKQYPFVYAPNGTGERKMSALELSEAEGWPFAINAGIFILGNGPAELEGHPDGMLIQDGEVLQGGESIGSTYCKPLTIDSNGDLGYVEYNADAQSLVNNGIVSAVTGFMPIIVDYQKVPDTEWNNVAHYTEHPQRQIIGQFRDGDYAIITCEGRRYLDPDKTDDNFYGWTIEEAQNICIKHGLKFAYNLDGGGSTETMIGLKHLNTIYEGTTGRKVPTFIVFNGTTVFGKPDEPITPDVPDTPVEPDTPDTPDVPDVPDVPVEPDVPEYVIPADYTEVAYIQTNGNQYINTNIPETELFNIEYKALNENWHSQAGHILSSTNTYYPFMKVIDGTAPWIGNKIWGNEQQGSDCYVTTDKSQAYTIRGEYDGSKYTMYFNGTAECSVQVGTTKAASNLYYLFAYGGNVGNTAYRFTGKLYYLRLWNTNGTLAHNYVPVKNSSGAYGLFDTATQAFHTADGLSGA